MNNIRFQARMLGSYVNYLKPNDTYQILINGEEAVGIRFPKKVHLKVTEADEGAKGKYRIRCYQNRDRRNRSSHHRSSFY